MDTPRKKLTPTEIDAHISKIKDTIETLKVQMQQYTGSLSAFEFLKANYDLVVDGSLKESEPCQEKTPCA